MTRHVFVYLFFLKTVSIILYHIFLQVVVFLFAEWRPERRPANIPSVWLPLVISEQPRRPRKYSLPPKSRQTIWQISHSRPASCQLSQGSWLYHGLPPPSYRLANNNNCRDQTNTWISPRDLLIPLLHCPPTSPVGHMLRRGTLHCGSHFIFIVICWCNMQQGDGVEHITYCRLHNGSVIAWNRKWTELSWKHLPYTAYRRTSGS